MCAIKAIPYELIHSAYVDNDYYQLIWRKRLESGILNPYQAVSALIDVDNETVVSYVSQNHEANAQTASITSDAAAQIAIQYLREHSTGIRNPVVKSAALSVVKANGFWRSEPDLTDAAICLAYTITLNDGDYCIYIDAVTGNMIGGSMLSAA